MVPVEGSIRCLWTTYGEIVARVDEEPDSRGSLRNICRGSFTARSPEASNLIDAGIPVSDGCIGISFATLGELGQLASWDKICTFRSGAKRSSLTTLSDTSATQALNPARYFSSKCGSDEANTVWQKKKQQQLIFWESSSQHNSPLTRSYSTVTSETERVH